MIQQLTAALSDVESRLNPSSLLSCNWCRKPAVRGRMYCQSCQDKRDGHYEQQAKHDESIHECRIASCVDD